MENEQRLLWRDIDKRIQCPFDPSECKINEGVKRYTKRLSHSAALFTSECNSCEAKGVVLGDPFDEPVE